MKIKHKILLIMLTALIAVLFANYYHFQEHFKKNLETYESTVLNEELRSVQAMISEELVRLKGITEDWAFWDDTFEYVTNEDSKYVERNLNAESVQNLDVDALLIYGKDGRLVYSMDYENPDPAPLQPDIAKLFESNKDELQKNGNVSETATGLLADDSIYLVAAAGITDSVRSKDRAGTLVFARRIDPAILTQFGNVIAARVHLFDLREDNQELTLYAAKAKEEGVYIGPADNQIVGVVTLGDISGQARVGVAVYKDALTGIASNNADSVIIVFTVSVVAIMALIYSLIRHLMTKPIDQIVEHLETIDISGKSGYKALDAKGNDELSQISCGVNKLFKGVTNSLAQTTRYLDMAGALIVAVDINGNVVLANRRCCKTLGINEEEILGKNWIDCYVPDRSKLRAGKRFAKLLKNEEQRAVGYMEDHIVTSNGQERLIIWHHAAVRDDEGTVTVVLSGEDITEKRLIHNMVMKSAKRLNKAEEIAHIGSWELELKTGDTYWSGECYRICGYEPGAVRPSLEALASLIHPEDRRKFETGFDGAVLNKGMFETEMRLVRPDGSVRWVLCKGVVEMSVRSEPEKIMGSLLDITEIKRAESQIKQNTERNEILVRILQYNAKSNQDLLDYVLNEAIKFTESMIGYIYLYDEKKREFELNTWSKSVMDECSIIDPQTVHRLDKTGIWGEAVRQRRPIIVNDFQAPSPYKKGYPQGHVELKKFLTIPIFSKAKIVAVIGVANKETDYTQMDVLQLTLLMNSVWEIYEREKTDRLLREERERMRITLLSVGDGVISTDKTGKIAVINEVAQKLTGWTKEEAIGRPFEEVFRIIKESTGKECESPVKKVLESKRIIELENHTLLVSRDGTERPVADSAAPILDDTGSVEGVVMVFRDFSEEKRKQDEIEYLSYHDHLTGLYNRRFFKEELRRLDNDRNLPLAVIMGDVNGLKLTNDAFGHAVGDRLLQRAAKAIRETCRQGDIIARVGGDEFVVLLPKTSIREAEEIVCRIRKAIANVTIDSVILSISFGYDVKAAFHEDMDEVLKKAEDAMYGCKLFESPSMRGQTVHSIIHTLFERNHREKQHSVMVSRFCERIGMELGLSPKEIHVLRTAGLLHDIGKIAVCDSVINKPGELTDEEREEMKRHPEVGYRILSAVNDKTEIAEYVLAHHERWDGSGYPKGLKGEAIPLEARIIAVADAYATMRSLKPYGAALSEKDAIEEILRNAGTQFDPGIAELFAKRLGKEAEENVAFAPPRA